MVTISKEVEMKKILILFLLALLSTYLFAYSIEKNYDGTFWDYQIAATNESTYSENEDGEKVYSHTVLIRDSKSKINYRIFCATENDALKTYYDYINKYKTTYEIRDKLIPELQTKVISYNTSDSGTWMFCTVSGYVDSYLPEISDDDFLGLFYKKYDTGIFDKEELLEAALDLFDDQNEFWKFFFGPDVEINSEEDLYKLFVLSILEELETEDNKEQIQRLRNELTVLIDNNIKQSKEPENSDK